MADDDDDAAVLKALLGAEHSAVPRLSPKVSQQAEFDESKLKDEFRHLLEVSGSHPGSAQGTQLSFQAWLSWKWLKDRIGPAGSSAIITPEAARDLWIRVLGCSSEASAEVSAGEQQFVALANALSLECGRATSIQSLMRGRAGRQQAQLSQARQASRCLDGVAKLAPFNPTPACAVNQALDALQVGPGDILYDLGCGDGRLLLAAARRGARAVGIEYDERFVERARAAASDAQLSDLVSIICGDACTVDLALATKVFVYLVPEGLQRMEPALAAALRSGKPIASYTFSVPAWEPSEVLTAGTRAPECKVWVYSNIEALPAEELSP